MMRIIFVFAIALASALGCRSAPPRPAAPAPAADAEDPQTGMEEHVLRIAASLQRLEQDGSNDPARERLFVGLARRAFEEDVRGRACAWILHRARNLRNRAAHPVDPLVMEPDVAYYVSIVATWPLDTCRRDQTASR